ncbi:sacsin N-terminal ATP-binding-like domain-containing protein [Gordonia iterans]
MAAWRDSPTRLAEDLAAEADLLDIGYRDRWFTELAANAADAAAAAGVPGRLRIWAEGPRLHVANTGAPLSVEGVHALTALRVSPKRRGAAASGATGLQVGRFGVGFHATGFADRVDLLSASGSITFDRRRAAVAAGVRAAPAQRLAWPLAERPASGFATEVVLHVRGAVEADALLAQAVAEVPDLLLEVPVLSCVEVPVLSCVEVPVLSSVEVPVLSSVEVPVLSSVEVPVRGETTGSERVLTRRDDGAELQILDGDVVVARWLQACSGEHRWLVPLRDGRVRPLEGDVLRSPTPTQIPLSLPARLITRLPLTPDRRELHPDAQLSTAAAGYADLVAQAPADQRHLLVPAPAFAAGPEDAELRAAILADLAAARWVPVAGPAAPDQAPSRVRLLRGLTASLADLLGEVIDGLVHPALSEGEAARVLRRLGAHEVSLADVADLLSGIEREPRWWARLYAALDALAVTPELLDELGALPVPRADESPGTSGRTQRGVRGLFVVDALTGLPPGESIRLDWIPAIDPEAYHPLLDRLGLEHLSVADALNHPALEQELVDGDHEDLADSVLRLLALAPDPPRLPAWLGALELLADSGELRPVDELLMPGSPLRAVLYSDAPFGVVDPAVVEAYGDEAVRRLGAGWGFTLVRDELPTAPDHELDAEEQWWDSFEVPPERLAAVRDLDLVDPAQWPAALDLLVADPEVVVELADPDGYTGWWLRRFAELGEHAGEAVALRHLRHPADDRRRGLFDPLHHPAADHLRPLLAGAGPDDADDAAFWLAALADPARQIAPGVAAAAHAALVAARRSGRFGVVDLDPPERLRTLAGTVTDRPVIVDEPWWLHVVPVANAVLAGPHPEPGGAAAFAALVDAPLASESAAVRVVSEGRPGDPDSAELTALAASTGWELSGPVVVHHTLVVAVFGDDGERRFTVPRWRDSAGVLHLSVP